MIKYLQHRFALTEDGAKDLIKGVIFTTLLNLALMLESVEHPWPYEHDAVTIRGSEGGKMNHIVSWLPCGSGFVIHQPDLFLSEVLPRFFK